MLLDDWTNLVLGDESLQGMGHAQQPQTGNLGLGWLYHALGRIVDPRVAVVIGSFRGFAPLMIARALSDNRSGGRVVFIEPSLVDDFWSEPGRVNAQFSRFGLTNVEHHRATTQDFVESDAYRALTCVDFVFIDGYHSYEQARFDFEAFEPLVSARGVVLLHDSIRIRPTRMYGDDKVYEHRVRDFVDELRRESRFQVFDLPFGDGLTLVRKPALPESLLT